MARLTIVGIACTAVLAVAAPSAAAFGSLDNTFGSGGTLLVSVGDGAESAGNGVSIAPFGALRVAGEAIDGGESKLALLRLDPNATPASLGTTLTPLGGDAAAAGIVTGPDGRSVVAGYGADASGSVFGFARYLGDGSLDTSSFGSGGTQQAAVGSDNESAARAVAAYGSDMFVAAGRALDAGIRKFGIVRLLSDGSIDPGFSVVVPAGTGGESAANAVASQADGKVVAAGYAQASGGGIDVALLRRLGNGAPDPEFGNASGIVLPTIGDGGEAYANALTIQPDSKLVVAGSARDGGVTKVMLARFNSDGSPDMGFGTGGAGLTPVGDGDDR